DQTKSLCRSEIQCDLGFKIPEKFLRMSFFARLLEKARVLVRPLATGLIRYRANGQVIRVLITLPREVRLSARRLREKSLSSVPKMDTEKLSSSCTTTITPLFMRTRAALSAV